MTPAINKRQTDRQTETDIQTDTERGGKGKRERRVGESVRERASARDRVTGREGEGWALGERESQRKGETNGGERDHLVHIYSKFIRTWLVFSQESDNRT